MKHRPPDTIRSYRHWYADKPLPAPQLSGYEPENEHAPIWKRVAPVFGFDGWKEVFLQQLCLYGTMTHAALEAGVPYRYVKNILAGKQDPDPDFVESVDLARTMAKENLELTMRMRAHDGDTIAGIFQLKAMDPEHYAPPTHIKQDINRTERIEIDIRSTQLDYRHAVESLAPPEVIEHEPAQLPPPGERRE